MAAILEWEGKQSKGKRKWAERASEQGTVGCLPPSQAQRDSRHHEVTPVCVCVCKGRVREDFSVTLFPLWPCFLGQQSAGGLEAEEIKKPLEQSETVSGIAHQASLPVMSYHAWP